MHFFEGKKNSDKHINTDDIFANYIGVVFQRLLEGYKNICASSLYLSTYWCKYFPVFSCLLCLQKNTKQFIRRVSA